MKRFFAPMIILALTLSLLACGQTADPTIAPGTTASTQASTAPTVTPSTAPTAAPTEPTIPSTAPTEPTEATEPEVPYDKEAAAFLLGTWHLLAEADGETLGLPGLEASMQLPMYFQFAEDGTVCCYADAEEAKAAAKIFFQEQAVIDYVKEACYAQFTQQGMSRDEADAALLQYYGMTMDQYVTLSLNATVEAMDFSGMTATTDYYVADGKLYILAEDSSGFECYSLTHGENSITITEATSCNGEFFLVENSNSLPQTLTKVN